jgi:hypothetical protein
MKRSSLVSIIVLALVVIGIVFYLARPRPNEIEPAPLRATGGTAEPPAESANASTNVVSCAGPINSQVLITDLDARHKWAYSLLHTNHISGALTELRNIATEDPGYPAINLEISQVLLKANRASEAKDAIKLQIEISDCLANLPQRDTQNYCKSQWASEPQSGCTPELLKINRDAHYEAGLVDSALDRIPASRVQALPLSAVAAQPKSRVIPPPVAIPAAAAASPPKEISTAAAPPKEVAAVAPPGETTPAPKPQAPVNIKTTEASEHVGTLAKVCGAVVSKHTAVESNGKPTFVNLDRSFPDQAFTVVVWGVDAAAVGELPSTGNVCVTGTVAMYRGVPQIVLHDAQSWSVASNAP